MIWWLPNLFWLRSNYSLLATIHSEKTTAVTISIVHAACEHPHLMSASPATVAGAMALAATPARCRRVTLLHGNCDDANGDFTAD